MQIVQRKSKDAELAEPVYAELQSVTIPGWLDEDEQPVTSAIVALVDAPIVPKKESKVDGLLKQFKNAWYDAGAEERNGLPYLSRSALRAKLMKDGCSEATADKKMKPGSTDQLIGALINAEIIRPDEAGWSVSNNVYASAMFLSKAER
jgi:hypothetical protein